VSTPYHVGDWDMSVPVRFWSFNQTHDDAVGMRLRCIKDKTEIVQA